MAVCPTQRAVDAGDSARFQAVFYASAFSPSDGVPPPAPALVNANRWAAEYKLMLHGCNLWTVHCYTATMMFKR